MKNKNFALILLAGILLAYGVITITNSVIDGYQTVKFATTWHHERYFGDFWGNVPQVFIPKAKAQAKNKTYEVINETIREITAYNAGDVLQTDESPCIAANGENICIALEKGYKRCAANFVKFGTRLHIDNYGECLVVDRMASRFKNRVDLAMKNTPEERQRAIKFGLQHLKVKIIK